MELLSCLLPAGSPLPLEPWHLDEAAAQRTLRVTSTQALVHCPVCRFPTRRIHSHYRRTLADLPWAHIRVVLQRGVRKLVGANGRCLRRIFTERRPTVAAPGARRTLRLAQRLVALGVTLGGAAGVHLGHQWALVVSRNTLLRGLRRLPVPSLSTPPVLGVDDVALHKRQTYGPVRIDLERRRPVAQWLWAPPGVEVIARERSQADAEGARHGTPTAPQVADRFPLLQNLREALDQVFLTPRHVLDAVNETRRQQPVPLPEGAIAVPVPSHDIPLPAQQRAAQRQAHRQALPTQIWALHRQGWTAPARAPQVGLRLRTVQRDRRTAMFAGRKRRSDLGDSLLNPYKPYLLERWKAGCYTAMRLWRARQQCGYAGSYALVAADARRLRQAQGLAPGQRRPRQALPPVAELVCQLLTPRRATWLVLRRPGQRTADEAQQLAQVRAQSAEVAAAIDLAQDFATLGRQRLPAQLDPWLKRATTSTLEAVRRVANGRYEEDEAVKAGVTLPWSTGPVEGHIKRLKMLKRQMFGRARLELLSHRFLLASRRAQRQKQRPQEPVAPQAQPAAA